MSDTVGADTLPIQPPSAGEAVADPCLSRLVAYFKAVVNRYSGDAWRTVMPKSDPVGFTFTHNPEETNFNERTLPAFYLYRLGEDPLEWLAEDYDISHAKLRLLWIFPVAGQDTQAFRSTFVNGIAACLKHFIELGRDPSYVLAGDTDPRAASEGSVIYRVANIWEIQWKGYKSGLGVPIRTVSNQRKYYHMAADISLSERRFIDIEADFPALSGFDVTVTTPDKARDLSVGKT